MLAFPGHDNCITKLTFPKTSFQESYWKCTCMYRKFIFLGFWEVSHCDTNSVSSYCQFFIAKFAVYIGIFFSPEESVRELTGLGLLVLGWFFFCVTDMTVVVFFFLKARLKLQDIPWPAWSIG